MSDATRRAPARPSRLGQAVVLARLRRERSSRARVDPAARLKQLIAHASRRSPYWQRALRGLDGAPLHELPVLTKDDLVGRFDDLVTDRSLRRADLEVLVREAGGGGRHGRYRVAVSSGSTGRPSIVAFDPQEWAGLLAASASMREIAGSPVGRSAKVGSPSPWHLSSQLGATLQDPRRPALRLPVTTPLEDLVAELERFRPAVLTAYPSILAELAGTAAIAPTHVFGGGEVLTGAVRRRVKEAWGAEPFDQYVTTEAGSVAGECPAHDGMHVVADHVIVEVVDGDRRPVAPGVYGDAVLVTVLSSRTLPLLRYELRDRVCLAAGECACGRPGPRIAAIAGRGRDVLRVGGATVHPSVLTAVLDTADVARWQVVQRGDSVRVLVVGPAAAFDSGALSTAVAAALPPGVDVAVEVADRLPAAKGKAALFDVGP